MKKIFSFLAIAAMVFAACNKTPKPTPKPDDEGGDEGGNEEQEYVAPITIDGDFADWATLGSKAVSAKTDPNANWDAVKEIRCYSDEAYVFYYIEFNSAQIGELVAAATGTNDEGEKIGLPIRLCINTDGEFESGYANYFAQAYDFIIEGSLAEDGAWKSFDGVMHQRIGSWVALQEFGLCTGAGKDNKYEICLVRDSFNGAAMKSEVTMPMGEVFQTGIRFYTPDWGELSNMPNTAPNPDSEIKAEQKGWGNLLEIHTVAID